MNNKSAITLQPGNVQWFPHRIQVLHYLPFTLGASPAAAPLPASLPLFTFSHQPPCAARVPTGATIFPTGLPFQGLIFLL